MGGGSGRWGPGLSLDLFSTQRLGRGTWHRGDPSEVPRADGGGRLCGRPEAWLPKAGPGPGSGEDRRMNRSHDPQSLLLWLCALPLTEGFILATLVLPEVPQWEVPAIVPSYLSSPSSEQ